MYVSKNYKIQINKIIELYSLFWYWKKTKWFCHKRLEIENQNKNKQFGVDLWSQGRANCWQIDAGTAKISWILYQN